MSSHHDDDDVIEFETPSAAFVTATLEMNAQPEIDDDGETTATSAAHTTAPTTTTEPAPLDTTITTTSDPIANDDDDDDVMDETDSILPFKPTILTPLDGQNKSTSSSGPDSTTQPQQHYQQQPEFQSTGLDDIDTQTHTDEFGNIVVTQQQSLGGKNSTVNGTGPQDNNVNGEDGEEGGDENDDDYDPMNAHFPPYDSHRVPLPDQETMGELYEDEMNFDPDPVRAAEAKAKGNKAFARGDYEEALECYAESLLFCPEEQITERTLYHNNKCAAHIMLKQWEDAIFEAHCVLGLDPTNVKALTRRAKAYEQSDQFQEAGEDYKLLATLEPKMKIYKEKEVEMTKKNEEKFEKQKEEMVDKLKGWGNSFLGLFGMSTDNFQFQQDPNTGSYSVNFSQNPGQPAADQQQQQQQGPGTNSFSFTTGGGR